jgi:hypothetical protein
LSRWDDLSKKYDSGDVCLLFIYARERHPGERGFPEYKHTRTDDERMAYARMWADRTSLPVVVDGVDDKVLKAYGDVPNAAFVIDRNGTLVFRGTWADARKVEHVLDELIRYQKAGKR